MVLLARYRVMSLDQIRHEIDPASMLYAWSQAGDEEAPRRLLREAAASDDGLICALEVLVSEVSSSDRSKYPVLSRASVDPFLGFEDAQNRLTAFQGHPDLGERATALITAIAQNRHF